MATDARKKAIELAKKIAKERDNYTCQKCGRSKKQGWKIDGCHILSVRYGLTAANPKNIIALCTQCHTGAADSWHESPMQQDWFHEKFPGLRDELLKIALPTRPIKKWEWGETLNNLRKIASASFHHNQRQQEHDN